MQFHILEAVFAFIIVLYDKECCRKLSQTVIDVHCCSLRPTTFIHTMWNMLITENKTSPFQARSMNTYLTSHYTEEDGLYLVQWMTWSDFLDHIPIFWNVIGFPIIVYHALKGITDCNLQYKGFPKYNGCPHVDLLQVNCHLITAYCDFHMRRETWGAHCNEWCGAHFLDSTWYVVLQSLPGASFLYESRSSVCSECSCVSECFCMSLQCMQFVVCGEWSWVKPNFTRQ